MAAPVVPLTQETGTAQPVWGLALVPAGCPSCKRVFLVQPAAIGQVCPACFHGKLAEQPAMLRPEPPELLVQFRKGRSDPQQLLGGFVNGVWLHGDDFTAESLLKRMRPIYLPMWLVDCDVSGSWQAEAGFEYQLKSSQESFREGRWISRDVVETRTRWEPRMGQLLRHYDNLAAPALNDHQNLMASLGEYQLNQCVPYQAEQVGTAAIRVPDLQPEHAWPIASANVVRAAGEDCRKAAGAEHARQYHLDPAYSSLNWTQMLLPMYVTFYTGDDGQPQPVMVNGQSGAVSGLRLASQKKGWRLAGLLEAAASALILFGLLASIIPPIIPLGILMILAGFGLAIFGIIPAVWPWQWNRGQQPHKVVGR